ncbi:MAG: hypothetical protein M1821_002546 [Bathelium mastoideum]|nr:MAG: hypothetical protein M1821_002546 [Bathelium mastoideum]
MFKAYIEYKWILLAVYSPILIIVLPIALLYERLVQNEDERVEQKHTVMTLYFKAGMVFNTIITFPRLILPYLCLGWLGNLYGLFMNAIVLGIGYLFKLVVFGPIFEQIVPFIYERVNSRIYKQLELNEGEVRVLVIPPGKSSQNVSISIKCTSLDTAKFEALSYSWGNHLVLRRAIKADGKTIFIPDSVLNALRELRRTDTARTLWIDSISIDQGNLPEKNKQVNLMRSVYTRAQNVTVWLGKAPPNFSAQEVMRQTAHADADGTSHVSLNLSEKGPINDILSRRWWSRVWIVQEVALNNTVNIRIGEHEFPWQTFSNFLQRIGRSSGPNNKILEFIETVSELQKCRSNPSMGLLELAIKLRQRVATKPHDKLFALQGLVQQDDPDKIELDYRIPDRRMFADFAFRRMERTQTLALMSLAESCPVTGCSWSVDWQKMTALDWAQLSPFESMFSLSKSLTLFWTGKLLPSVIEDHRSYSAAGPLSSPCIPGSEALNFLAKVGFTGDPIARPSSSKDKRFGWTKLKVIGWIADTISLTSEPNDMSEFQNEKHIWDSWIQVAGGSSDKPEVRKCVYADVLSQDLVYREDTRDLAQEICLACTKNRRLFRTKQGRLGLGPAECERGDRVCILAGSPVPFVLDRFLTQVKGQAYVNDIMDYQGDLEQDIRYGKINLQQFIIC